MAADGHRVAMLEERLRILSGALRAFAEATADYVKLVDVVAKTLAEVVRDGCVVRLLDDDGWLSPVAVHLPLGHIADARTRELVEEHITQRHHIGEQAGARQVIETGDSLLVPRIDLVAMRQTAVPAIVDVYEKVGIHSVLLVALRVRGKSIGCLSLARFGSE